MQQKTRERGRVRGRRRLALGLALAAATTAGAESALPRTPLTLDEALRTAFDRNPVLSAQRAALGEARGRLVAARTWPYNPEVGADVARRRSDLAGPDATDYSVSVSQELELAGQSGKRAATAGAELRAAEAVLVREGRLLAALVERAFADAVGAREALDVERADREVVRQFLAYTERRFEAGAASALDLNLARATAGRAERRFLTAEAAAQAARSLLAEVTGLDPADPPEPAGLLALPPGPPPPLPELIASARDRRADLRAFESASRAAEARLRLARALAVPNVRIGGFYSREDGVDTIVGAQLSIGLPLFNRNQGGIAEARAGVDRSAAESRAVALAAEREVAEAWARHRAAQAAAERLREQVVGSLEENLGLLQRAFEAGKVGATELLLFRREFVEAQREFVAAAVEAWTTRVELELASGRLAHEPPPPPEEE